MGCTESKAKEQRTESPALASVESSVVEEAAAAPAADEPPRTYQASKMLLGKGGSAKVFAGACVETKEPVAVKVVDVKSAQMRQALEREYETLRALPPNAHVVSVRHFEVNDKGEGIIIMGLVTGGTLRKRCERGAPLPDPTLPDGFVDLAPRVHELHIRRYLRDALRGLAHLHRHQVVHRDLKPDNVLVCHKLPPACGAASLEALAASFPGDDVATVQLTDFGSCKMTITGGVCQTTVNVVGTVPYMSHEAIRRGKFSEASDIWAFGVTFVELATPWQDVWARLGIRDPFQLLMKIGSLPPPNHMPSMPPQLSPAGQDVVRRCLAHDPAQRPTAAALLRLPYFADLATLPEGIEGAWPAAA